MSLLNLGGSAALGSLLDRAPGWSEVGLADPGTIAMQASSSPWVGILVIADVFVPGVQSTANHGLFMPLATQSGFMTDSDNCRAFAVTHRQSPHGLPSWLAVDRSRCDTNGRSPDGCRTIPSHE